MRCAHNLAYDSMDVPITENDQIYRNIDFENYLRKLTPKIIIKTNLIAVNGYILRDFL